jgi:hypothetical protein
VEREQHITDLDQELKQVREVAAAENKRIEDELAKEKRKARRLLHSSILFPLVGRIVMLMILSSEVFL